MIGKKSMNKPMIANSTIKEDHKEKSHILHEAIQQLDYVVNKLDDLINRIQGPLPDCREQSIEKEHVPYLLEVLENGPRLIYDTTEEINNRIDKITELLF